jgi:hypothetical protein
MSYESLPAIMNRAPTAEDIGLLAIRIEATRGSTPAATDCEHFEPSEPRDYHTGYPGDDGTPPCRTLGPEQPGEEDWCQVCKYRERQLQKAATARRRLREWIRRWRAQHDDPL